MRFRALVIVAVGLALVAGVAGCKKPAGKAGALSSAAAASCDRACLAGIMDRYLAALPTHSSAGLPLAGKVKFTEQAAAIPVGDGLWISATEAPTTFKIIAADPTSGQVGALVVMKEWGKPIYLAARLKVEDDRITEIEHVIARDLSANGLANLAMPRPGLLADVPAAARTPRAEMLAAADAYFEAIERDDGNLAPFADDCVRHENGLQTTTNTHPVPGPLGTANPALAGGVGKIHMMGCRDAMNTGYLQYITMIRPRHLLIVDEQKGLVLGFPRFVHRGDVREEKIGGVPSFTRMPITFGPNDLQAAEMFKITDGKIHDIEAMGFLNAYGSSTGWDAEYPETYKYATTHPKTHPYAAGTSFPAK